MGERRTGCPASCATIPALPDCDGAIWRVCVEKTSHRPKLSEISLTVYDLHGNPIVTKSQTRLTLSNCGSGSSRQTLAGPPYPDRPNNSQHDAKPWQVGARRIMAAAARLL